MPGRWAAPPAPAMSTAQAAAGRRLTEGEHARRGVRWAETTRTSWGTSKRSSISVAPSMTGRSDELPITTATSGAAALGALIGVTTPGGSIPSGTGVPERHGRRPGRGPQPAGVVAAHRHVAKFPPWAGRFAIEVDVGALDGQSTAEPAPAGSAAPRPAEDVDAGHLGVLGRGRAQAAGRGRPARGSRTGRSRPPRWSSGPSCAGRVATSLTRRRPPDQNSSTAMTPTAPAISATFCARAEAASTTSGRQAAGHQHLAAHPVDLGRLDRRPRAGGARGAPGHHDGELGVERHELLDEGLSADLGQDALGLGQASHRPHAPAVVAAPGGLEHERPAVRRGEGLDHAARRPGRGGRTRRSRPRRRPGRRRRPASRTARMRALSTASSSAPAPGVHDGRRRRASAATRSRSTCSWSKVTTRAQGGQGLEVAGDEGRPDHHLGGHVARGVVGPLGQHGDAQPERAGRLAAHPRQLAGTDEAEVAPGSAHSPPARDSPRQWGEHNRQTRRGAAPTCPRPLRIGTILDRRRTARRRGGRAAAVRRGGPGPRLRHPDLRSRRPDPARRRRPEVPGIALGTGVVPVYPRHPMMLAQQALTVQWATAEPARPGHRAVPPGDGRGRVGPELRQAGPLHAGVPGLAAASAARRDGLERRGAGHHQRLPAARHGHAARVEPPPVLVAALGPAMLRAGRRGRPTAPSPG